MAQPADQILEIAVTPSSRVSLTARETPLADVLRAIGEQAGVKVVLRGDFNPLVMQILADVPLDAAIQRLSRWHSVVLIYDTSTRGADDPVLQKIWITSVPTNQRNASPAPGVSAGAIPGTATPERSRRLRRDVLPVEDQSLQSKATATR
jgi:hypothetical protein